jgi:hypothetical protein
MVLRVEPKILERLHVPSLLCAAPCGRIRINAMLSVFYASVTVVALHGCDSP